MLSRVFRFRVVVHSPQAAVMPVRGLVTTFRTNLRIALRDGRVVPFVGAGVSMAVRSRHTGRPLFPSWREALRRGARELEEDGNARSATAAAAIEARDYTRAAREIRSGLGAHDWQRFLEAQFGHREIVAERASLALARAIWDLGSGVVITTNFDDVLRWDCPYPEPKAWELENRTDLGAFLRGEYAGAAVWHLHGRYDNAENVIFTLEAYRALYHETSGEGERQREEERRYEAALSTLRAVLLTKSLLFVGFSLDDEDFVGELRRAADAFSGFGGEHFALVADTGAGDEVRKRVERLEQLEVTPIFYSASSGDHSALLGHLRKLSQFAPQRPRSLAPCELPDPHDRFVGRKEEVRHLSELLTDASKRLVALVGPSGSGKTRLSREVAAENRHAFLGRVRFADLTEATSTRGLAHAVARALGVPLTGPETPAQTVRNLLRYQARTLLVLDHFEQLLDIPGPSNGAAATGAADQVREWCEAAPEVSFLITSTSPLDIGEHLIRLRPLEFVELADVRSTGRAKLESLDSVTLFVARRTERDPAFQWRGENEEPVGRICARLRGLPLGIELAARHTAEPRTIDGTLADLLQDGADDSDGGEITRELEASLRLSVQSLEDAERQALVELGVCNGDFFEADAHAMLGNEIGCGDRGSKIVATLSRLGLLQSGVSRWGSRLAIAPPVRSWACRRLTSPNEQEWRAAAIERHRVYYLNYGEHWVAQVDRECPREALDRLGFEVDDIVAIHDSALARGDVTSAARAVLILAPTFAMRGPTSVLRGYAEDVLGRLRDDEPALRCRLCLALAREFAATDVRKSKEYARRAMKAAVAAGDNHLRAEALQRTAWTRYDTVDDALAALDEAAHLYGDDRRGVAWTRVRKGQLWYHRGSYSPALSEYDEAERTDDRWRGTLLEYHLRRWRGETLRSVERFDEALDELGAAERIALDVELPEALWDIKSAKAIIQVRRGNVDAAEGAFRELRHDARLRGNRLQEALALLNLADTHRFARDLAEQRLAESSDLFREVGIEINLGDALANRAMVLRGSERRDEAREYAREAHRLYEDAGALDSLNGWIIRATLARAEQECGAVDVARTLAKHALSRRGYAKSKDPEIRENWDALVKLVDGATPGESETAADAEPHRRFVRQ